MSGHTIHRTLPCGPADLGAEVEVAITFTYLPGTRDDLGTWPPVQGYAAEIEFVSAERFCNGKPCPMETDHEQQWLDELCRDWLADDGYSEAVEHAEQCRLPDPDDARDRAIEDRMMERDR